MNTPRFLAPVLIFISLISIWRGLTADFPASTVDNGYFLDMPSQVAASISTGSYPEQAETEATYSTPASIETIRPDDPYLEEQWALEQIQAPQLWPATTGNPQPLVAILDTGIDHEHEDLNHRIVGEISFTDSPTTHDLHGHGTHIAGIIAATGNNGLGIAGLAPNSLLLNVKVADDKGKCSASDIARGIIWAIDNGANVINLSLELREPSPKLEDTVNYAWNNGAVVIAAAGNDGSELPFYPASYESCIAVTAIREDNNLAPLANHGNWVDVAAPGFNICSTLPDNCYGYKNGTSFAAAHVSGLAALLFSAATDTDNDGNLNDEVRAAIEAGCQDIGIDGTGKGRIDAVSSMTMLYINP